GTIRTDNNPENSLKEFRAKNSILASKQGCSSDRDESNGDKIIKIGSMDCSQLYFEVRVTFVYMICRSQTKSKQRCPNFKV
ncbi:24074_t:CDS:2, partial [Cetraspora pellucida]